MRDPLRDFHLSGKDVTRLPQKRPDAPDGPTGEDEQEVVGPVPYRSRRPQKHSPKRSIP